jgi:hypothetical protein
LSICHQLGADAVRQEDTADHAASLIHTRLEPPRRPQTQRSHVPAAWS